VKTPTKKGCEVLINGNRISFSSMQNIHFIQKLDHYVVEVIYDYEPTPQELDPNSIASIDLGLNNLATVTFNPAGVTTNRLTFITKEKLISHHYPDIERRVDWQQLLFQNKHSFIKMGAFIRL
jgi:putative transposase